MARSTILGPRHSRARLSARPAGVSAARNRKNAARRRGELGVPAVQRRDAASFRKGARHSKRRCNMEKAGASGVPWLARARAGGAALR